MNSRCLAPKAEGLNWRPDPTWEPFCSRHLSILGISATRDVKSHATVMQTTILVLLGKIVGHLISINGKRKKLFLKKAIGLAKVHEHKLNRSFRNSLYILCKNRKRNTCSRAIKMHVHLCASSLSSLPFLPSLITILLIGIKYQPLLVHIPEIL